MMLVTVETAAATAATATVANAVEIATAVSAVFHSDSDAIWILNDLIEGKKTPLDWAQWVQSRVVYDGHDDTWFVLTIADAIVRNQ